MVMSYCSFLLLLEDKLLIEIRVKYFGVFSQITRKHSETLILNEGVTINDMIDMLCNKYGRNLKKRIKESGYGNLVFLINGVSNDGKTILKQNDTLIISYPVGGG